MNKLIEPLRNFVRGQLTKLAKLIDIISGGRISPNHITYTGLLAHFFIAWLIGQGNATNNYHFWAGLLLIIFGLFDSLDGALARLQHSASTKGMLLDSITDRLKEVLLYAGIAYFLVNTAQYGYIIWAVLACGISVIVSYVNAWGEVVAKSSKTSHKTNKTFRTGIMSYDIRMLTLVIALFTGFIGQILILITILAFWTACERFYLITKKL